MTIDDIAILCNCKVTAESVGEAFNLIDKGAPVVKLPNCVLDDLLLRRSDGSFGILVDIINNFRDLKGEPLGHLDTNQGKVAIPRFWPIHVLKEYGLPHREGKSLIVDAYVLNSYWNSKIITTINKLPCYHTSGFQ